MSDGFRVPEDPGEFAAWLDNFAEQLPKYAEELGITREELEELRKSREFVRADLLKTTQRTLAALYGRLKAVCPVERWPRVFQEAFARLPITREPDRSQMLRLLGKWVAGVERAYGGEVRPVLSWKYCPEGIRLEFSVPKPCEGTMVNYRFKGRAAWQFFGIYTRSPKIVFTAPEYLVEEDQKRWPGSTLEFVAVGWFEEAAFGFPCEPVAVPVPALPAQA